MKRYTFKTTINAPREKVWDALWNDKTYQEWSSAFTEGSRAETDWKEGSKVKFLDAKGDGIVSTIAAKRPNELMSFKHIGEVRDGLEDRDHKESTPWAGAMENYILKVVDGKTELTIETDLSDEWKDYFHRAWPKALEKLKSIVER